MLTNIAAATKQKPINRGEQFGNLYLDFSTTSYETPRFIFPRKTQLLSTISIWLRAISNLFSGCYQIKIVFRI